MSYPPAANSMRQRIESIGKATMAVTTWLGRHPWLALPLLVIPALWPFAKLSLTDSADGILHLLRLVLLDHHVRHGMLYPRWVPELSIGLGYPVFNFYGPLTYYLAELLHLIGLDFVSALIAAFAVLVLAGGFGMYLLARDVLGPQQRWAALVAATAYMYAPYLLTNVYIRGAIAEVGAQAWLPWVFWSARRLLTARRPSQYVLPVALSLGGLAVTHNITLLFMPFALAGYVAVVWWQTGHSRARLGWMALAIAAAMGVSAFFWVPVIAERVLLAGTAYKIAATVFVPENVWTWRNFLDMTFAFKHTFDIPFQLGLVQGLLALAGLIAIRRRDTEWLYFIALAVVTGLGISAWSQPLWLSSRTLLAVQFPWRLLSFMAISLCLFTGAILVRLERDVYRFAGVCGLIALIVLANRPQVDWMPVLARTDESLTLPTISQFELDTGQLGTTSTQEFRPRWSVGNVYEPPSDDLTANHGQVSISQASDYSLRVKISTPQGGPLRFTSLYYPAWRVTLEDGRVLPTYPSTDLGLLTVDLPPGAHAFYLRWAGTDWQRLATWLSLITLAVLTVFVWRTHRPGWLAVLPLSLLIFGLVAALAQPAMIDVRSPPQPIVTRSLEMLGYRLEQGDPQGLFIYPYRLEQGDPQGLFIYPYWYTRQTPPANTQVGWQLRDATGRIVNEVKAWPYFNSQNASNWPPATLVDDAYRLSLPPGLAAGTYELAVQVVEGDEATAWTSVGTVEVKTPVSTKPQPAHALAARFGGLADLTGVDLKQDGRAVDAFAPRPLVVRPGDSLEYTLYWQARQALPQDYNGSVHLVDREGRPLVKQDHLAGSLFRPPMLWDTFSLQPDRYPLRIPQDTPSGLYWPMVGLYEFEGMELLPVEDASGQPVGDRYRLPPVKVLGAPPAGRPQHEVSAQLGDLATLVGYDLALPEAGLRAGSQISLTLYYRTDAATAQDLTRFAQLYSPELGMAAQQDAPPAQGANPTWSWVPGEVVSDTITLTVGQAARSGKYALQVGLYTLGDGVRLPVRDRAGNPLPDGQVVLTELSLLP